MKPSEALRIARKRINAGEQIYICYALPGNNAGRKVKKYISLAMRRLGSYSEWLNEVHSIPLTQCSPFYGDIQKLRRSRLAWIDWMIAEYEKIGE